MMKATIDNPKTFAKQFKAYHRLTPAKEGELAVMFEQWDWTPRQITKMLKLIKGKKYY